MRKATSPEVQLYPAAVESWVQRHKFDVSLEERWRAALATQINDVDLHVQREKEAAGTTHAGGGGGGGGGGSGGGGASKPRLLRQPTIQRTPIRRSGSGSLAEGAWEARQSAAEALAVESFEPAAAHDDGGSAHSVDVDGMATMLRTLLTKVSAQEHMLKNLQAETFRGTARHSNYSA